MGNGEILGTTKITDRWRISLIKAVREEFDADESGVEVGDRIVYRKEDGKVIIEPA